MSSRPSRGAARLAAILDALPDGLLLVNCNGTVVNANTIALETFETPGTALVGRGLLDLLPEFDSKLIPGSMRRPAGTDALGRTKPTRMIARRTDGSEFPVEVTSANLEDGRDAFSAERPTGATSLTGDELLMLVVRDLSGTVDTEAELARSQRQTEMILRAASEGVVGTDTEGRIVLANPAAAQILGFRASDLGGKELHALAVHSRADGTPFPYEESPLADTLKSGRKHRVRGQVLWAKSGKQVPVDLTTAPVRDGEQLVGAVMTFTDRRSYEEQATRHAGELERLTTGHAEELERLTAQHAEELSATRERYDAEVAFGQERLEELTDRHTQLSAVLGGSLRGPLEELRGELGTLASDPAGQLWPEANQVLHHLAAGYARMTTLVDNVLGFQRLASGVEPLVKANVLVDGVVAAAVEGAVELIGPGRVQFAVHAPAIEAEVDGGRLATALAHLVADVAGVDSTGKVASATAAGGGYVDSTIVVAVAQRGEVVRFEVRGPYAGGDPVHEPIVRGIVQAHGGVLQTHEVPGMTGNAYVLEVPIGAGSGVDQAPAPAAQAEAPAPAPVPAQQNGGRRARRSSTDAFLDGEQKPSESAGAGAATTGDTPAGGTPAGGSPVGGSPVGDASAAAPSGRRRARRGPSDEQQELIPAQGTGDGTSAGGGGTGRRRGRPSPSEEPAPTGASHDGSDTGAAVSGADAPAPGAGQALALPGPSKPADLSGPPVRGGPGAHPGPAGGSVVPAGDSSSGRAALGGTVPPQGVPPHVVPAQGLSAQGAAEAGAAGRRAPHADGGSSPASSGMPALPPAPPSAPGTPAPYGQRPPGADASAMPAAARPDGTAPSPDDTSGHEQVLASAGAAPHQGQGLRGQAGGGRRARRALATAPAEPEEARSPFALPPAEADRVPARASDARPGDVRPGDVPQERAAQPAPGGWPTPSADVANPQHPQAQPLPQVPPQIPTTPQPQPQPLPLPAGSTHSTQGRAFSVRTLGQGMPFSQQIAQQQNQTLGSGRRRKLAAPSEAERPAAAALSGAAEEPEARPHPQSPQHTPTGGTPTGAAAPQHQQLIPEASEGRAYAIGAPDEGSEGPEPLDGPGGAVEVSNRPVPQPVDDELPPEPLDNPRRLLVWPAPDASTEQALSDRGYRPVIVHSREEVDAQIAAFPAALFVDPLTGPITRTALQSLRQAAVAAEVPVLVTAGLGQATREAAYGADPAVLLKALAPRDSEQHPPRVLLIEEHEEIALALTATLERRGMQIARAATDTEAVNLATQMRPNLVVMDLMLVRRRRAGIVDWLRANGQLNRTPLVVYTSAGLDQAQLPRLSSGETVLFLAERSTSAEVQGRIVDLLAKIGTN
ncbi:PAS domain-containing protein [Streptomyces sp. NBC_00237]|uniref:PAS domain-containing protein n=1 Tax=Streptomyces sp. NBC_00237 TaxID=2975687 RepID=UPI002256AF1B|nr:PAS domain-containing protein [Streptomyces sp. NBC_00237]MCX5199959.1 PAS domain-containing protein [Streptomyces sp. NBC_00237]